MEEYTIKEIRFASSDGSSTVCGWIYSPIDEPKGIIQISHGMCEYIGRYHDFMAECARAGYVICGHDHIGHGKSSPPEMYGYFGRDRGFRHLVSDLHYMTRIVKKEYPQLPCFLLGHSMGSFVARLYLSKYSDELTGVILSGTAGPNPLAKAGAAVCEGIIASKGPLHRSPFLDNLAFGAYNRRFSPIRTSKDWLTRDTDIVDKYINDPQCMFLFTACGYRDLFQMVSLVNQSSWYRTLRVQLPVLLISGDMDPVGDYGKGIEKVFCSMQKAGLQDVTMTLYPDARHELLNEINREEVYADVLNWIGEHLPSPETL